MIVVILEPFLAGSHEAWARGFQAHSSHEVVLLTLPGRHWKWRMHGGAVTLAKRFLERGVRPDLILATDMLDVAAFLALTRNETAGTPAAVYFHENQLTYPWSPKDRDRQRRWDVHYAFVNYTSALACDRVFFNSRFHMESFLEALPGFLNSFPDHREPDRVDEIREKSAVLPLGLDLQSLDAGDPGRRGPEPVSKKDRPLVLWNHRWEYDKNPGDFFAALRVLAERGRAFDVALLGEAFDVVPQPFLDAADVLGPRIVHSGFVPDRRMYAQWLRRADILPVTSNQDFFGGSVVEAMYCGSFPILPRRLAYPERVPEAYHDVCLYDTFDELVGKLDDAIQRWPGPAPPALREAAARCDWRRVIDVYDRRLFDA